MRRHAGRLLFLHVKDPALTPKASAAHARAHLEQTLGFPVSEPV